MGRGSPLLVLALGVCGLAGVLGPRALPRRGHRSDRRRRSPGKSTGSSTISCSSLVATDDAVALYYDKDVDATQATAIFPYVSRIWMYTQTTYGSLGPGRLYVIIHKDRYLGCHEADHFSASHDYRNVIDCGITSYDDPAVLRA